MGLLLRAWDGSRRGRGQVVLIQGEAGVGKSRLVEGLREASGKDRIWVAIRCSPFHTASAFYQIIEHLKRVFGWQPEDTAQQHLAKRRGAPFSTISSGAGCVSRSSWWSTAGPGWSRRWPQSGATCRPGAVRSTSTATCSPTRLSGCRH